MRKHLKRFLQIGLPVLGALAAAAGAHAVGHARGHSAGERAGELRGFDKGRLEGQMDVARSMWTAMQAKAPPMQFGP